MKRLHAMRRHRARCIAGLLAVALTAGPAAAADDNPVGDTARKVGDSFGELVKGAGQKLKKAGDSIIIREKKEDKKKQRPENESDKDSGR